MRRSRRRFAVRIPAAGTTIRVRTSHAPDVSGMASITP
jgi:hypothetical protein